MTMHYRRSRGALAMLVIVLVIWLFNAMKVWRCSRHDWLAFLKVHESMRTRQITYSCWCYLESDWNTIEPNRRSRGHHRNQECWWCYVTLEIKHCLFLSLHVQPGWLHSGGIPQINIREGGNPSLGCRVYLQGFVRIELVRHHSYGNSKVCDDVTFFG